MLPYVYKLMNENLIILIKFIYEIKYEINQILLVILFIRFQIPPISYVFSSDWDITLNIIKNSRVRYPLFIK